MVDHDALRHTRLDVSLLRLGLWPRLGMAVLALLPLWAAFWWALA